MTDHINPGLVETARPLSRGLAGSRHEPRPCRVCDITFQRTPGSGIPDELCRRCHEGLEALKAETPAYSKASAATHHPAHTAAWFLEAGLGHMQERAATYDKDGATVAAFQAITGDGRMDTAERGWLFMVLLKCTRAQQGQVKTDNYEDAAAYCGLMGEAALAERQQKEPSA